MKTVIEEILKEKVFRIGSSALFVEEICNGIDIVILQEDFDNLPEDIKSGYELFHIGNTINLKLGNSRIGRKIGIDLIICEKREHFDVLKNTIDHFHIMIKNGLSNVLQERKNRIYFFEAIANTFSNELEANRKQSIYLQKKSNEHKKNKGAK